VEWRKGKAKVFVWLRCGWRERGVVYVLLSSELVSSRNTYGNTNKVSRGLTHDVSKKQNLLLERWKTIGLCKVLYWIVRVDRYLVLLRRVATATSVNKISAYRASHHPHLSRLTS
jgi:hypothetical protein